LAGISDEEHLVGGLGAASQVDAIPVALLEELSHHHEYVAGNVKDA
jgi:hypothetical protein